MIRWFAIRNMLQHPNVQPPINPTPRPYLRVIWIRTLPWVTWEAVTGMEGTPCRGLLRHMPANRALNYPSHGGKYCADGCMALGRNSCVVNDPLGEPGHTQLYVGLPSAWGSVDGDRIFSPFSWKGPLTGDSDGYK
jgi:hypothetical protein